MASEVNSVFICHGSSDKKGLGELVALIEAAGISVVLHQVESSSTLGKQAIADLKSKIYQAKIANTLAIVIYIDASIFDNDLVDWAIRQAAKLNKRVVGIWARTVDRCDRPQAINDYADAVLGWNGTSPVDGVLGKFDGCECPDGNVCEKQRIKRHDC
jgi:hypothetical protein